MGVDFNDKIMLHVFRKVKCRWEVGELRRWEGWKGNEVGRWEVLGFIHRVSPRFYLFVSNVNQGNERTV